MVMDVILLKMELNMKENIKMIKELETDILFSLVEKFNMMMNYK